MLVTFKSKAAAEVVMYKEHAQRILELLHKNVEMGVITSAETAGAIQVIEAAMAESKAHPVSEVVQRDIDVHHSDAGHDNEHEKIEPVSFSTRAYPLLEMLHAAHKDNHDILWGVL
jgi:hypothetical protein